MGQCDAQLKFQVHNGRTANCARQGQGGHQNRLCTSLPLRCVVVFLVRDSVSFIHRWAKSCVSWCTVRWRADRMVVRRGAIGSPNRGPTVVLVFENEERGKALAAAK